jgi:hypothetical protein
LTPVQQARKRAAMPLSMLHEGLLLLFQNRPLLAPELLRDVLGVPLPAFTEARVDSAELTEVVPTQYHADLVVLLLDSRPVFGIVVEVQLARDPDKRRTWPVYLSNLRARLDCPTALLVVTADEAVAAWAGQPIDLGHPGFTLRPLVMGPGSVPVVTDEEEAKAAPERAVLSAMAHGREAIGWDVARAVLAALPGLEEDRARLYLDLVGGSLNDAARKAFEALMQGNYEYQTDFARKYYGQGKAEGRTETAREDIYEVLAARGLQLSPEHRQHIASCEDFAQLKAWLRLAATATSVEQLLTAAPRPGSPGR